MTEIRSFSIATRVSEAFLFLEGMAIHFQEQNQQFSDAI
jgi:hypothetical protein